MLGYGIALMDQAEQYLLQQQQQLATPRWDYAAVA